MEDLRIRLNRVEVMHEDDFETIRDAIAFIDKVVAFKKKLDAAAFFIGYVPKENNQDEDNILPE